MNCLGSNTFMYMKICVGIISLNIYSFSRDFFFFCLLYLFIYLFIFRSPKQISFLFDVEMLNAVSLVHLYCHLKKI